MHPLRLLSMPSRPSPGRPALVLSLLVALLVVPAQARAYVIYQWKTAVSGSADDPTKWNPSGVPGGPDIMMFTPAGAYTVTVPGTVPTTSDISLLGGNVSLRVTSPHTTGRLFVSSPSATMTQGSLFANWVQHGQAGVFSTLTFTGLSYVRSTSTDGSGGGDRIGYDGITETNLYGGARYFSAVGVNSVPLQVGVQSSAAATMSIAGFSGQPRTYSGLITENPLIVGASGVANLFVYNGGYVDAREDVMIARDPTAAGYVTVGPVATFGTASILARKDFLIGNNKVPWVAAAGHGEVTLRDRSSVLVLGACRVGDPDNDAGSVLRIQQGGNLRAMGSLHVWPTAGPGLDLKGGVLHVRGGEFAWPANKTLYVTSTVGTPLLWIANGVTNTGPNMGSPYVSGMFLGRSGSGVLRLCGAGTVLGMSGAITLADSVGGYGSLDVDSLAQIPFHGTLVIGNRGTGFMRVRGGARVEAGIALVAAAGGSSSLEVSGNEGNASRLYVKDNLWIGGSSLGPGGTATVAADAGGMIIAQATGLNYAIITVYPGSSLQVSDGAVVTASPGLVDNQGQVLLRGGLLDASEATINSASGEIRGWGSLSNGQVINAGLIGPFSASDAMGSIGIDNGTFRQNESGRYDVSLSTTGGLRCDTLVVGGEATLGGLLALTTEPGFVVTHGDTFTVLLCASRRGTFERVSWNGNLVTNEAVVLYGPTWVRVVVVTSLVGVGDTLPGELRFAASGGISHPALELALPDAAEVMVRLYDVSGRERAELLAGRLAGGRHRIDISERAGQLANGVYFARATIRWRGETHERTARAVLVR